MSMRYLNFFSHDALRGLRVGVYQHSAVGRDVLVKILSHLGAEVTPLGRSDKFIPVDTEAIRPEDVQLAHDWAATGKFDALVSADGDSDRPLVSDEHGNWLRGDIAGILCAKFLAADSVSTPVSCNTAVEKCGWFAYIRRTRIGSPFVVASMMEATAGGAKRVVGYEANGGFLLNSDIGTRRQIAARPADARRGDRDAGHFAPGESAGQKISELSPNLPARFTASDRLKDFPTENSAAILRGSIPAPKPPTERPSKTCSARFAARLSRFNRTDGLRITFANEEVIHLRPSGNAPEFRCYAGAATDERAREITSLALARIAGRNF